MTDVLATAEAQLDLKQRFRIARARARKLLDRLWDESKHPRVPAGQPGGGQFGDSGAVAFVSPNVADLKIDGAIAGLNSPRQEALRRASADVDVRLGKNPVEAASVVGAWSDGAENSLKLEMPKDWTFEQAKVAMAMKGWLGDQKSALVFKPDPNGDAYMASLKVKGSLEEIHQQLLDDGLAFHTLEPTKDGAVVHIYGDDQATMDAVDRAAGKHDTEAQFAFGHGAFIGTTKQDGTDREQRDDARRQYEAIIAAPQARSEFEGRDVGKIWNDLRARWGGELSPQDVDDGSVPGRALTSNAIIAEAGDVKSNSRKVQDVAKEINERAGKILQADLGVDAIDLDNRTDETDDYLAGVIAQELKDGLTNGRSAVDWYDRTMKSAMDSAEKLYPGIAADPDKRFAYTAALAISSQGEVVDSTVRLADQAYSYFAEHGKFPTDIKAADPNIVLNLKKVNAFIDKLGIAGTRDLFSRQMTVRDLKKVTGYGVSGMGMDDMVYGSAVLGPKIGQGFYQNLNGNFAPITMDMWFMRAWGRITNTGIGYTDMAPQYQRLNDALKEDGKKVPRTEAGTLKLAREINAQHEKDYIAHQDDYKSGKIKKTEAVFASERIVLNVDGAMVEQPKGVNQRRMITEVFHKALDKLNSEGIRINPASAQATWWWPEQVLYDKMGARVRENDNDYAKSLKKLADSRGLKQFDYVQGLSFAPWINDPDPPDYLTDDEIEANAEQAARYFGVSEKQLTRDAHSDWMDECVPELMDYGKDQTVAIAACLNMWRDAWEESHPDGADDPGPSRPGDDKYDDKQLQIARGRLGELKTFDANRRLPDVSLPALLKEWDGPMPTVIIDQKADIARSRAWQREKAKANRFLKEWDESKHPRVPGGASGGHGGEFGEGGGGGTSGDSSSSKPKPAKSKKPAKKEDFDKAKIRFRVAAGQGSEQQFIDKWNEKIGMEPEEFKKTFLGGVDASMNIVDYGNKYNVTGDIYGTGSDKGAAVGEYNREINIADKEAYSAYFKLNKSTTKHDIGKKVLGGNVEMYEALGIEKVKVSANIDVGGYAWAKYGYVPTQASWNDLRGKLENKLGGGSSAIPASDTTIEADDWSMLSDDVQSDVRDRWMRDSRDEFVSSEEQNWRESGQAKNDAKVELADEFTDYQVSTGDVPEWVNEALDGARNYFEERGQPPIPYTNRQLYDAVELTFESRNGDGEDDPDIGFDDSMLKEPAGYDPAQGTLPGIDPEDPSGRLTKDMRNRIEKRLIAAFDKKAEDNAGDMEAPSYLVENVAEYQDEYWDQKSDREKLQHAIDYDMANIDIEPDEDEEPQQEMELPPKVEADPLLDAVRSSDPKSIWKVADSPQGKALLLGTGWSGVLNLKDKESMDRFNKYVGRNA